MAGIQIYDYLYSEAQTALGFCQTSTDEVNSASGNLDSVKTLTETTIGNISNADGIIESVNDSLDSLGASLDTANSNIDQVISYINAEDSASALALLGSIKDSISTNISSVEGVQTSIGIIKNTLGTMNTDLLTVKNTTNTTKGILIAVNEITAQCVTLINSLVPLITDSIKKIGVDLNVTHNYVCHDCSLNCPMPIKFKVLDAKNYPKCLLDGSNVTWKEENSGNMG